MIDIGLPSTSGEWHRTIWSLSWPVILANITIPLVGLVDTAVMGRLPDPAYIGSVAVGTAIMTALYWLFGFLRMGTTGLTAQALGAGEKAEIGAIAVRAMMLALLLGGFMIAGQVVLRDGLLWLFEASERVEGLAADYFAIRVWGAPAMLIYMVELGILFGTRQMRATLVLSILLNVTNVILDVLFVVGFGLGVQGVAAGTVISELFACTLGFFIIRRVLGDLRVPRPDRALILLMDRLRSLFSVSANLVIRTFFVQLPFFTLTLVGAAFGDLTLAANAVLIHFFHVMAFSLDGYAHSVEALAGYAYGAREPQRLRQVTVYATLWAGGSALLIGAIYLLAGELVIALITQLPEVRATAASFLPWVALLPLLSVFAFLFDGIFIGTTRIVELRNSMFLACAAYLAAVLATLDTWGNHGLWFAMCIFMSARSLLLGLLYPRIERLAAST
ncbi:MAG: MATE family efflux transporter [Pseudomonadales bacterium]|nr:MATE family efflux transporter [Pseudomonadales bacterium]MDP6470413.1 MATE family efflux transporter [Pseudomonadales bacterium]MDP6827713.1 MATE family efflux transporter [Pseudomonadales bacterium]MDP6973358.1 MATE family efflux transporter [Pseudomonadales bacterium]